MLHKNCFIMFSLDEWSNILAGHLSASIPKWGLINGRKKGENEINKKAGSRGKNRWTSFRAFGVVELMKRRKNKQTYTHTFWSTPAYEAIVVVFYAAMDFQ